MNKYTYQQARKQIDFQLYQKGDGFGESEKMMLALLHDRTELFKQLEEIAGGDGNLSMDEIRDFVKYYSFCFKSEEDINQEVQTMYAEITKQAFDKLVDIYNTPVSLGEELEHARKTYWNVHGVKLLMIDNYLSNVTQYYVMDINS